MPRTPRQAELIDVLDSFPVVFALGPAGTGKTYVAARHALSRLISGEIDNITIARPTVAPARHRLGFLPGGQSSKMRPWLVPIMDAFQDGIASAQIDRFMQNGQIEALSFEFFRGRTLRGVTIVDEGQNCSFSDLELALTRIGDNSQMIICGDPHQTDIEDSGLAPIAAMVADYDIDAAVVQFTEDEVVRSAAAAEWVKAFGARRRQGLPLH